jgi:hypothetical protein
MKYLILTDIYGMEIPIVFPETLDHKDVANRFTNGLYAILSAGKCSVYMSMDGTKMNFSATNGSVSLGLTFSKAQTEKDAEILTMSLLRI